MASRRPQQPNPYPHASSFVLAVRRWADHRYVRNPSHPVARARDEFDDINERIAAIDRVIIEQAAARRLAVHRLVEVVELIWPRWGKVAGRRPPGPEAFALPPVEADATLLAGVELRSACMTILRRHGTLRLVELHRWLHLYGLAIASQHPVKKLSEALCYEVRQGRAERIERGVYALADTWSPRHGGFGDRPLPHPGPDDGPGAGADTWVRA